jgi:hypothetical protein
MDEYIGPADRPPFENIAVHEAGHGVIASVLGFPVKYMTIIPNRIREGYCNVAGPAEFRFRGDRQHHANIIQGYAARLAEIEILGKAHAGISRTDNKDIEHLAECCDPPLTPARLVRLESFARMLVRRHHGLIREVAAQLLIQGRVSGAWVRRFIADCRSID